MLPGTYRLHGTLLGPDGSRSVEMYVAGGTFVDGPVPGAPSGGR